MMIQQPEMNLSKPTAKELAALTLGDYGDHIHLELSGEFIYIGSRNGDPWRLIYDDSERGVDVCMYDCCGMECLFAEISNKLFNQDVNNTETLCLEYCARGTELELEWDQEEKKNLSRFYVLMESCVYAKRRADESKQKMNEIIKAVKLALGDAYDSNDNIIHSLEKALYAPGSTAFLQSQADFKSKIDNANMRATATRAAMTDRLPSTSPGRR